jgi:hypothetical protein
MYPRSGGGGEDTRATTNQYKTTTRKCTPGWGGGVKVPYHKGLVRTQNNKYLSLECLLTFSDLLAAKKASFKAGSLREHAVAWLLFGPSGYVTSAYNRLSA